MENRCGRKTGHCAGCKHRETRFQTAIARRQEKRAAKKHGGRGGEGWVGGDLNQYDNGGVAHV